VVSAGLKFLPYAGMLPPLVFAGADACAKMFVELNGKPSGSAAIAAATHKKERPRLKRRASGPVFPVSHDVDSDSLAHRTRAESGYTRRI
jgi:hypothetical protein